MATVEKGDNVRAVGRALEILLAFEPQDSELSAGELLKRVDLSRPTLYRLLYTLQEHGFILSVGDPQRFRLGPAIAKLAHIWTSSLDLPTVAQPVLRRIWEQTGETVAMFVPEGNLRLCVAELPSPQPLSFKRGVGYTERIVRGASGRAILAYMDSIRKEVLSQALESGLDPLALEEKLAETRKCGIATSHNELIHGAVAIAAPFFDRTGAVAGSIGVFGPEVRLNKQKLMQLSSLLLEESAKLSNLLGFTAPTRGASK